MGGEPVGQSLLQLGELLLALVLSSLVGLEREIRHKSAGLRTYTLVGVSAALFMLISKYGFTNVLEPQRVVLDPSRVAAQIVSGIGFIGGGVIFMRRDVVRGLTTAASVWLTAALGMACGAGLPILAVVTTAGHFLIMFAYPRLVARLLPGGQRIPSRLRIVFHDRPGALRRILQTCSACRFTILHVEAARSGEEEQDRADGEGVEAGAEAGVEVGAARPGPVSLTLQVKGRMPVPALVERLLAVDEVTQAATVEEDPLE
jgi:putative Mg2+ transporter-C (MgtC) family protein